MNPDGIGLVEAIVIDVSDLRIGAAFWSAVTGKEFGPSFETNFLRARSESGLDLVLQEVPDVKTGKKSCRRSPSQDQIAYGYAGSGHRDRREECDRCWWNFSRSC